MEAARHANCITLRFRRFMKNGETPHHIVGWAVQDWLNARVRTRTLLTGDLALRCVYFELLNVLYANAGSVPSDPLHLSDMLMVPVDEVHRCMPMLLKLGYITLEDGHYQQPRVTRTLARMDEVRQLRAVGGRRGGRPPSSAAPAVQSELAVPSESVGSLENANLKVSSGNLRERIRIGNGKDTERNGNGNGLRTAPEIVFDYWLERSHTKPRSGKVTEAITKRISARLNDGLSVEDLKRAVDVACTDEFYVQRGYFKQPDVIFRNAERVSSLLARSETKRGRAEGWLDEEATSSGVEFTKRIEKRKAVCAANPRKSGESTAEYVKRINAAVARQ